MNSDTNFNQPVFFVDIPYRLGVHVIANQLCVPSADSLKPLGMFPQNAGDTTMLELLKDYLAHFSLHPAQVFPLYEAVSMGDPMQSFTFITLEAFLLILFTKAPSYMTHVEADLRKKLADFIRKSLVVMISFLQVKQPAISTSSHQASSESLQSFLVHMAPSAMQNGFDFSQISASSAVTPPAKSPSESGPISHESDFESTSAVIVKFEDTDD